MTALQGCQRADRASTRPTRRPCLLRVPPHAPHGQQPRVSGCRARPAPSTLEAFWSAHIKLMTRSMQLTEDDLVAVATDLGVNAEFALGDSDAVRRARARVEADVAAHAQAA